MVTKLKVVIDREKMTMAKLSQSSGVHYPHLCSIARGDWRARAETQAAIADALGVPIDAVFDSRGFALEVAE